MNFFDVVGKFIHEAYINTAELQRQLKGFHAIDTPLSYIGADVYQTNMQTKKQQLDKQIQWTIQQRNASFDRVDKIARHHIATTIKDIIISDGFNDINNGNTLFLKYTDPDDSEKSQMYTEEIMKMIKKTGFLDMLRDAIYCEGLDYGELFLSKVVKPGKGIIDIVDDIDLRQHVAIYSKGDLLGAVRLNTKSKQKIIAGDWIPEEEIAHFMLNYRRIPLEIKVGKDFEKLDVLIKEKIRCALPILDPVVDLILQYNQLEQISTAIEISRAIQPILLGVAISPEQDITKVTKQLQDWSAALNKNKNNVINNLDTIDVQSLLQSMNTVELVPYSAEDNTNAMSQIKLDYGDNNLAEKINNLRKTIALAVGVPEQYVSTSTYMGQKDTKEDTIQTNPRYSMMLSRIQQLLAKGIREVCYSHLKNKFCTKDSVLKRTVEKERIEVIFKSCTNLNDRIENENMLLRAETMGSLLAVIDNVAGSPNLAVKAKPEKFMKMWQEQLRNNPDVRDMFEVMTTSEHEQQREDNDLEPNTEPKLPTKTVVKNNTPEQQADMAAQAREKNSEKARENRKVAKALNDGDDIRDVLN